MTASPRPGRLSSVPPPPATPQARAVLLALVALLVAIGPVVGQTRAERGQGQPMAVPDGTPAVDLEAGIAYRTVDGQHLKLDAYLPSTAESVPAVVLVHGGFWTSGSRQEMQQLGTLLAERGYAAFSVDYRLAPKYPFPASFDDVQTAVAWLRDPTQVDRFGIDPDRIGILGSSSGGQIAGLVGVSGQGDLDTGERVRAVVSLSGPMNLTASAAGSATWVQVAIALNFLGCTQIADCPAEDAASPITQVDPSDPPFLLVHARDDPVVPVQQSRVMADKLEAVGITHDLEIVSGRAHGLDLLRDPMLLADVLTFLDQDLAA